MTCTEDEGEAYVKSKEAYRRYAYPDPASPLMEACRANGIKLRWGFRPAQELLAQLPPTIASLSAAPWTCGYGETDGVTSATEWTEDEASIVFHTRYKEFQTGVLRLCTVQPTTCQIAAMTSLAYNIGLGAFEKSSVLAAHNRRDFVAASKAFGLWNKAGGRVRAGLTARRAEESAMYLRPEAAEAAPVSNAVEPPKTMAESKINQASVVAGGTAAIASATQVVTTVKEFTDGVQSLGSMLVPALLVVAVAACGYIIYQRYQQRHQGVA